MYIVMFCVSFITFLLVKRHLKPLSKWFYDKLFAGNELHLDDQDNEPINTSIDEVINEPLDDITEEQVTLSRPLHQIIKETFQEEIDELSKELFDINEELQSNTSIEDSLTESELTLEDYILLNESIPLDLTNTDSCSKEPEDVINQKQILDENNKLETVKNDLEDEFPKKVILQKQFEEDEEVTPTKFPNLLQTYKEPDNTLLENSISKSNSIDITSSIKEDCVIAQESCISKFEHNLSTADWDLKILSTNNFTGDTKLNFATDTAELISNVDKEIVKSFKVHSKEYESKQSKNIEHSSIMDDSTKEVRVLTLNANEHQDTTLYRLKINWIIQFRLGPSLFGRKINLYCNYPQDANFNRTKYQLIKWTQEEGCKHSDDTASFAEITVKIPGSFHYYYTYDNELDYMPHQGSGFILVDPIISYGKNENLPLDCIQCHTVLAKSLGSFSTWENKLKLSKESGYNMIHFTPIQELGASNSSYSLRNQLKLNRCFNVTDDDKAVTFKDVKGLIAKLRNDWKVTSICDIVLNHTANESDWLIEHPEATYNCNNCTYMRPAYLLDAVLHLFSIDIKKGLYDTKGIPEVISEEQHLNAIRHVLHTEVLQQLKLQELFVCDPITLGRDFLNSARSSVPLSKENKDMEELKIIQDKKYKRLASTVDMKLALKLYNTFRSDCFDEESRLKKCSEEFKSKLEELNDAIIDELNGHINSAVENCIATIRYFRVQGDGPRVKEITLKNPLVFRYFTDYGTPKSLKEYEDILYSDKSKYLMAHNGWVMNADPLRNFADSDSNVYIRRELIAWGDSVKLRYGEKPEDCPYLWQHMKTYVEQTAEIFDGVRLDNCHSTPINVAEYLLDCARKVRPHLYVVAELFTNSDQKDNIFVNRLGITSLIREAMSAWDSHEEGRLVYRYGGDPVGAFFKPNVRPLVPSIAHALFLDLTHDNPSPVEKRSIFDLLPSTALVNMACCASGSNRGYDEIVPHHIHVVDETREYCSWTDEDVLNKPGLINKNCGIISAKKALNDLHFQLAKEGFNQVYVDQMDGDIVAVTRHRPTTHESVILVAFTAFSYPDTNTAAQQRYIKPLKVEGSLDEIILEATLSHKNLKSGGNKYDRDVNFVQDDSYINGLMNYQLDIKEHIQIEKSTVFSEVPSGEVNKIQLNFKDFKPGSIVVIKVSLHPEIKKSMTKLRQLINNFSTDNVNDLQEVLKDLTLADLNRVLYRCDQEERDEGHGIGAYNIPDYGDLVYCGLQGIISPLAHIRPNNDLGHPICRNLRDGNWLIDYVWQRLLVDPKTIPLGNWIKEHVEDLKRVPRYLVPSYFDVIFTNVYLKVIEHSFDRMSNFVKHGSTFVKSLSLGSVQFSAFVKSAPFPLLSPNLTKPVPEVIRLDNGDTVNKCVTLSAGLPHFSTGYTRNWGRDTFIALRGLLLLTGRHDEARYHILAYAACLRHGLIPNLLDKGKNSRFNCRDAIWWWLYSIKCYCEEAPNGFEILSNKVARLFPTDDAIPDGKTLHEQELSAIMQESLNVHFQGLIFRERNAGKQIDEHMTDRGFDNQIGVHPETGFVFGGNEWNCGTWMDKMGSSEKAGIRGKPATPRDGSAIELIGLSKAVITWLAKISKENKYPCNGVKRTQKNGTVINWTFAEWSNKIQNNFEKYFWIDEKDQSNETRADLINKRCIFKDSYGATQPWTDYQLRCNFPVTMVVAPELFDPKHAWLALKMAEKYLLGPLGMKTLDPDDWAYCGDYDNSNDSNNSKTAHGFNYHQGPEWLWPVGFFLRALLKFAGPNNKLDETISKVKIILSKHFIELQTSVWRGLPELTNSNGTYCRDSSRTQAWSMACILEVLQDLQNLESNSN